MKHKILLNLQITRFAPPPYVKAYFIYMSATLKRFTKSSKEGYYAI